METTQNRYQKRVKLIGLGLLLILYLICANLISDTLTC